MIDTYEDLAVELLDIKAIKIEDCKDGYHLTFEFKNVMEPVYDPNLCKEVLQSVTQSPVKQFFDNYNMAKLTFEKWVEAWQNSKE